jgi:hypothetical protein
LLAVVSSTLELEIVMGIELEELKRDLVMILQIVDERACGHARIEEELMRESERQDIPIDDGIQDLGSSVEIV